MSQAAHTCDVLVLSCIDFRFHQLLLEYVRRDLGVSRFDLVALAGGAKNLATPTKEWYEEAVLDNIGIAVRLHGIKRVVLTNHMDCGAYGGSEKFAASTEEIVFHEAELRKAEAKIREKFPDLEAISVLVVVHETDRTVSFKKL